MTATAQPAPLVERFRRVLAGGCAALVFALTIFAASPAAHDLLHRADQRDAGDDACAVVLFAGGVALPAAMYVATPPECFAEAPLPVAATEVLLLVPRYLRQPERGPPADRMS
jgi:hypothetical protein